MTEVNDTPGDEGGSGDPRKFQPFDISPEIREAIKKITAIPPGTFSPTLSPEVQAAIRKITAVPTPTLSPEIQELIKRMTAAPLFTLSPEVQELFRRLPREVPPVPPIEPQGS